MEVEARIAATLVIEGLARASSPEVEDAVLADPKIERAAFNRKAVRKSELELL